MQTIIFQEVTFFFDEDSEGSVKFCASKFPVKLCFVSSNISKFETEKHMQHLQFTYLSKWAQVMHNTS